MITDYYILLKISFTIFISGLTFFGYKKRKTLRIFLLGSSNILEYKFMLFFLKRWNLVPSKTKGGYLIPYIIGTQHYHIFVEDTKKKNLLITEVVADGDALWTEQFRKLLGHNGTIKKEQKVTPKKLGFDSLEVKLVGGRTKKYEKEEHIEI